MSEGKFTVLFSWILVWSFFAINQLTITYDYLKEKPETIYIYSDSSQVDKNQDLKLDKINIAKEFSSNAVVNCKDENYWNNISFKLDQDQTTAIIQFPKTPKEQNLGSITLNIYPMNGKVNKSHGYRLHTITKQKLLIDKAIQEVELKILNQVKENGFKWFIEVEGKDKNNKECYKKKVFTLDIENFKNFKNIEPTYKDGIFNPVDTLSFDVSLIGEERYFEIFFETQKLKKLHNNLPLPHEAGVSLLEKNLNAIDGEYIEQSLWLRNRLEGDVVVGLFGNVTSSDLQTMNRIIQTLHIIAPQLDISYSDNSYFVNLPIHFLPCNEYISEKSIGCLEDNYIGLFSHSYLYTDNKKEKFGWIWVDSSRSKAMRSHVLIHEFGHALGLRHNKCYDSVMSYNSLAPEIQHFSHVDLTQLRILYDPKIKMMLGSDDITKNLNLNETLIDKYRNNDKEMCTIKNSLWNDLIEFQKGNISRDVLLRNKNK